MSARASTSSAVSDHLLDTNIVLRVVNREDPQHALVSDAVAALGNAGAGMCVTPQNLVEFWNVATRPAAKNGLGRAHEWAATEMTRAQRLFRLVPDHPDVFEEWKRIVLHYRVSGVRVHDARLAAFMRVHGVPNILTFNTRHFTRFPFLTVVNPREIVTLD